MERINAEKWLCTDGKTWRAGCRKTGVWWTVKNEKEADKVVENMHSMSISEARALADDTLLDQLLKG